MRIFRLTATMLGALALSAVFGGTAHAAPAYPPTEPHLTASAITIPKNGHVVLHGRGYLARERVDLTETRRALAEDAPARIMAPAAYELLAHGSTIKHVRTNRAGRFTTTIQLDHSGTYTITATGEKSGRSASIVLHVLPPASGGGGGYGSYGGPPRTGGSGGYGGSPRTRSDAAPVATVGGSLLAAGLLLAPGATMWRRRSTWRTKAKQPKPIG
jgi:hypothetical protein